MHDVYVNIDLGELLRFGVPFAIVVGWLSGRLLGVRRGWGRAFVAGLIGWLGGVIVAASIEGTDDLSTIAAPTLFFGVLFAMFASIAFDLLLRPKAPRHRRLGWLLHPIAAIRRRLAPLGRFREIIHHARERGLTKLRYASASKVATPDFARRLRLTLEDCGGMFVKFGQIASTRSDLLPSVVTDELAQLQSAVRPVPADQVREVLEAELGATVEEEFASFDWEPLAAASIGQTHRATLKTGQGVVVKVQRPGIEDVVNRDAVVLRLVASTAERRIEAAHQIGLRRLADDLITSLRRELDYAAEAANAHEFREDRVGEEGVSAPGVYLALSTRRVLVMEEVDGTTVADHAAVAASGVAPAVLSRPSAQLVPRPGAPRRHLPRRPAPGERVRRPPRHAVVPRLRGRRPPRPDGARVDAGDGDRLPAARPRRAGSGHTAPGRLGRHAGQPGAEGDIGVLLSEVLSGGGFDPQAIGLLLEVMQRHGLQPPRAMMVLSRALLTLEGTLRTIDAQVLTRGEANELLPQLAGRQEGAAKQQLEKELLRSLPVLRTLPGHLEGIASQLRVGRLGIRVERFAGPDRAVVGAWIDRVVFAAIGMFGLVASSVILVSAQLAGDDDTRGVLEAVGFAGIIMSAVMLLRSVARIVRAEAAPASDSS